MLYECIPNCNKIFINKNFNGETLRKEKSRYLWDILRLLQICKNRRTKVYEVGWVEIIQKNKQDSGIKYPLENSVIDGIKKEYSYVCHFKF